MMNAESLSPSLSVTTEIEFFAASKLIVPSPLASIVWKSLRTCTEKAYEIGMEITWNNIEIRKILDYQRKLKVKFPTIWKDERQRREEWRRKEQEPEERRYMWTKCWESRKSLLRNIANVFPMIRGSGGSKSTLAKAAGAEPPGQMRNKKLHAAVTRNAFWSQNGKKKTVSAHFLDVGGGKIARHSMAHRCGAKHIYKSNC